MNYPLPNDVSGSRSDLIKSYKQIISKNRDANFPMTNNNCFRICVYNVYQFRFLYNSNKNISCCLNLRKNFAPSSSPKIP